MEQLDRDILDWISQHNDDPALASQLAAATVKRRDYMKTGFFVYLDTAGQAAPVASGVRPTCPHIESAELMDGAGCTLFLRNGKLHYLEIYARGGFFPEDLDKYRLTAAV
jgi:hypothetical protein